MCGWNKEENKRMGWKKLGYYMNDLWWSKPVLRHCFIHVFPSEGFFQQVRSFPGDFQNKQWWDWVTCTQNWGNHIHKQNHMWCEIRYLQVHSCDEQNRMFCALYVVDGHEQPEPSLEILQSFLEHTLQWWPRQGAKGESPGHGHISLFNLTLNRK